MALSISMIEGEVVISLNVINDSINPNSGTPKAVMNIFMGYEFFQI